MYASLPPSLAARYALSLDPEKYRRVVARARGRGRGKGMDWVMIRVR